jgi:putative membrane protein
MPAGSEPPRADRPAVDQHEEVFRLHPLTPIALGGRVLGLVAAFSFFSLIRQRTGEGGVNWVPYAIYAAVALAVVVRGFVNVAVTRYHLLGGELRIDYGLFQKQSKRVRLNRVQSVDLLEPLAARIFGLAELKVTTAGTERAAVRLRYLALPVARALRADLLGRSVGADEAVAEAPERPVLSVPHGRLVRAVLLEMVSWRLLLLLAGPALGLLGQSNGHRPTIGLGVALFVSFAVVILHAIWHRVSSLWDFTISESPDGLRIRHGLLSTSRQTVPPGRIQAILVHQPMSWRLFGWAQVRMNVAGYAGNANSKSTMLVPVTDRAYALALVGWVSGGIDIDAVPMSRPPARAALRAPLWWRGQWAGSDERVFVVRHGLLSRTVDVVPHERTQSVRLSAGPLQRALGLATVHLDSTRGPVKTRAKYRDAGQARLMLDREVELGRRTRGYLAPTSPLPPSGGPPPAFTDLPSAPGVS